MKRTLLIYLLLIASIPVLLSQPDEFAFVTTPTSGGAIATVELNGVPASASDWIAAFDTPGGCVGAVQLLDYGGEAFCNLQVYGNDTTTDEDDGMDAGETFTFRLWVAATGEIISDPEGIEPVDTWDAGLTGQPCPGYAFSDGVVLRFATGASGCTDDTACNYDPNATEDDGTCEFLPAEPTDLACYETATANTTTCSWDVTGDAPVIDDGCDVTTDSLDEATCTAVNTPNCAAGESFDAANCACTADPVPGCIDDTACNFDPNATVDDGSCNFLPAEPTDLACYETATANTTTCSWDVTGDAPVIDDGCDVTTDSLDEATCTAVNTPNCAAGESFDAANCACTADPVPGCTDATACNYDSNATEDDGSCNFLPAEPTGLACYETATANTATCSWDVTGDAPVIDDGCDVTTDSLDEATCTAVNTPNCGADETFDAATCSCNSEQTGCTTPPSAGDFDCE